MAVGIAVVLPMINTYGIAVTNALSALLVWISFGYVRCDPFHFLFFFRAILILTLCIRILCCIIQYGESMRAYCDVGFSTAETN